MVMVMLCLSFSTYAYDFEVDGFQYSINSEEDRTVTVVGCLMDGDVEIPKKLIYHSTTYTVTQIGWEAFARCIGLTSVTIPNSVTSIGENAFAWCVGLKSVTIPNSVTHIGVAAFAACKNLEAINVQFENSYYSSIEGILYDKNVTELISFPGAKTSVTIPNSVTSIGENAFHYCGALTSVTIPASVISIGKEAFLDCSGLTSVTIPNSVTYIGGAAFKCCDALKVIYNQITDPFSCYPGFSDENYMNTMLYVPVGSLSAYNHVDEWRNFWNIEEKDFSNSVDDLESEIDAKTEIGRFNSQGLEVDNDYKGVIIIKYSDGSSKKILN